MSLGQVGRRRTQSPVVYPNGFLAEMTSVKFLTFLIPKLQYFQTVPVNSPYIMVKVPINVPVNHGKFTFKIRKRHFLYWRRNIS